MRLIPMLMGLILAASAAAVTEEPLPGEYRVVDGRVDRGTYFGWRVFHSACYGCHGFGATGTDIAPNLLERVRTMTPRAFAAKVLTSYRLVQPGVGGTAEDRAREREATLEDILRRERGSARSRVLMPAWQDDLTVTPHVLDLYAWLSARADGKLGPGQPPLMSESPSSRQGRQAP
jgi:hypothetical protein